MTTQGSRCLGFKGCFPLGTALQTLGFALMAGGMLALGAFTAPVVFGQFPREAAGPAMAIIFRRYDLVLQVALGLALLGELLRWLSGQLCRGGLWVTARWVLLTVLTGCLLYATGVVNPQIEQLNRAGFKRDWTTAEGRQFEQAHKLSEGLYKVDLLLVILLILLTPFADAKTQSQPQSLSLKERDA